MPPLDLKRASTGRLRWPNSPASLTEVAGMAVKQKLEDAVRSMFHRPSGLTGRVSGWLMAHRFSNRIRNLWAVSLLEAKRDDRVLEIGFGPGLAITELSRIAVDGYVCGIDHSELMVRQAAKRNAEAIKIGRVELRLGSAESLPAFETPFDKVLAVNALPYWDQPAEWLPELRGVLRTGGRIAIAYQPRGPRATDEAAVMRGEEIAAALRGAGFSEVRIETLRLRPAVVCVVGVNGSAGDESSRSVGAGR
jgi:SAM-dependent methyltransferase